VKLLLGVPTAATMVETTGKLRTSSSRHHLMRNRTHLLEGVGTAATTLRLRRRTAVSPLATVTRTATTTTAAAGTAAGTRYTRACFQWWRLLPAARVHPQCCLNSWRCRGRHKRATSMISTCCRLRRVPRRKPPLRWKLKWRFTARFRSCRFHLTSCMKLWRAWRWTFASPLTSQRRCPRFRAF